MREKKKIKQVFLFTFYINLWKGLDQADRQAGISDNLNPEAQQV